MNVVFFSPPKNYLFQDFFSKQKTKQLDLDSLIEDIPSSIQEALSIQKLSVLYGECVSDGKQNAFSYRSQEVLIIFSFYGVLDASLSRPAHWNS